MEAFYNKPETTPEFLEFYERLNSRLTGLHPAQWLRALAEGTGAALRASVADGTGDWRQLWALLCGLR